MKIIYMGTPEFAVPCLDALIKSRHKVVAVVTQTDKPVGRSGKLKYSPVKELALSKNLPVLQFGSIRKEGVEIINGIDADIIVTCAYGQILSADILFAKKFGVINVHGSILPKYRGASPIQSAIINGEKETGITILKSGIGIDDGPIINTETCEIYENETYEELAKRLSFLGAKVLLETLDLIEKGMAEYKEQDNSIATHCKMFKPDFGKINFDNNAQDIVNLIHGINPSPVAFFLINEKRYKVYRAQILNDDRVASLNLSLDNYKNGEVCVAKSKQGLIIKANDGFVSITEIQPENGKKLQIRDFLNGGKISVGDIVSYE